ncbi:hypothetical protein C0Q70_06119 [Pomacea canaliculata]|uniref:Uncharacterized protein n=1 Tax=Pomacea canaliculata TaxID=400727 RepID=A0A2T7PN46_POMCA|nr:hypothetical protein C0Q70_06119 [Pomacea canaliculata]
MLTSHVVFMLSALQLAEPVVHALGVCTQGKQTFQQHCSFHCAYCEDVLATSVTNVPSSLKKMIHTDDFCSFAYVRQIDWCVVGSRFTVSQDDEA